jgi:hypothetical protein
VNRDGDPQATTTVLVGIVGIILLLVLIIFTIAVFHNVEYLETVRKVHGRPYHELRTLQAQQQEALHAYRWINQSEGIVGIPISRAITLAIRDLNADPQGNTISQPSRDPEHPSTREAP